jgi:exosortase
MLFSICVLLVSAINVGTLRALVTMVSGNPTASHVLAIPVVTVALIYLLRDSVFAVQQPSWVLGPSVVLSGVALSMVARAAFGPSAFAVTVGVAGIAVSWVGGFIMCFGVSAARVALFPLAFLVFMVPMPELVIDHATSFLKAGSAEVVSALFTLTGTPYHRDAYVFSLPTFVIEIADECSGIRSSIALLLTSLLAGHSYLTKISTRTILVLAILPAALLKNGIRIVSLSLLAMHVDPSFLTGQLHHEGGILFFALTLVLLMPVFVLLQRSDRGRCAATGLAHDSLVR